MNAITFPAFPSAVISAWLTRVKASVARVIMKMNPPSLFSVSPNSVFVRTATNRPSAMAIALLIPSVFASVVFAFVRVGISSRIVIDSSHSPSAR